MSWNKLPKLFLLRGIHPAFHITQQMMADFWRVHSNIGALSHSWKRNSRDKNKWIIISPWDFIYLSVNLLEFMSYKIMLFQKHVNSKVQKPPSQLLFLLMSIIIIIITITSNEPWNTETHKMDGDPPITDHKPWLFEPV